MVNLSASPTEIDDSDNKFSHIPAISHSDNGNRYHNKDNYSTSRIHLQCNSNTKIDGTFLTTQGGERHE